MSVGAGSDLAVVFDCDGVLVDSEVLSIQTEVEALAAVGIQLTFREVVDRYVGMSDVSMRAAVAEEFGVDLDEDWWAGLRAHTHEVLASSVRPVAGIPELVAALDVPYCLASSSSHERLEITLGTAGLAGSFPPGRRFSAQDVRRGKPAPDLFLHAATALRVEPGACVVVEDSPYGIEAAVSAGMRPIGFLGGGHADRSWGDRLWAAGAEVVVADVAALWEVLSPG